MLATTTGGLRRACSNAGSRDTIVDSINSKTHTKVRYPVHNFTLDFLPRRCNTNSSSHIVSVSNATVPVPLAQERFIRVLGRSPSVSRLECRWAHPPG
jgi:hypothetical protein